VLLPMANVNLRNPDTNAVESADEVGKRLGLEVRSVGNVQEAFALFTDDRFAYPSAPAPSSAGAFDQAGDGTSRVAR
jgi:hypothetical protein